MPNSDTPHITNNHSMIFKTWLTDLTKIQGVVNNIKSIELWANGATGLLNPNTVNNLSSAINGLTLQQAQLALSTRNLTQEQMNQVLVQAGLIASEDKIQAELVQSALVQAGVSAEKQKAILTELGLMDATTGEIYATKACTKEELLNMLATKGVTGANAEAIISILGIAGANGFATISFELLTASIWANIKAFATWLATNPVGWLVLATGAIWGAVKAFDALTVSFDEAVEKTKSSKEELDQLTSEISELNKELETTKDRIEELLEKANSGTISLLEEEELNNLREQNDELQREIDLKEKLAEIDAKEAAKNAAKSITYKTDDDKWDEEYRPSDRIDKLLGWINSANYWQEKLSKASEQILDIEEASTDNSYKNDPEYKKLIDIQNNSQNKINEAEQKINSIYRELSEEDDGLYYNGKIIEGYEDLARRLDVAYTEVELYFNGGNIEDTTEKYVETIKNRLIESGLSEEISNAVAEGFSEEELNSIMNSRSIDWSVCLGLDDATTVIENIKEQLVSIGNVDENPISSLSISDTIDQLNTRLKPALDSLSSAWNNIFTDDEFALNSIDILSTCDSIKSKLDDLNEIEGITVDYSSFEDFVRILSDSESGAEDVKNAFESLAASITHAALSGTEDFETMKAALEDLGVVNNEIVAFDALVRNTEALTEAGLDLAVATDAQILEFVDERVSAENLTQAIAILTYQKRLCELQGINTSNEVANLRTLAENAGYTAEVIQYLTELEQIYQQIENGTIDPTRMGENINRIVQLKLLIEESAAKIDYKPIEKAAAKAGESYADAYMDALKDKLSNLGDVINYISDTIGDQIDLFEDQKDAAVDALEAQKEAAEDALEAEKTLVQEKIDAKQAEIDAIEEAAKARKNEINLQKAQYDLERMQNQKTSLVYSEEKGMHYVADTKEIRDAREAVTEAKENIRISNMQTEMSGLNDIIDSLEKKIEDSNRYYSSLIEETEKYWDALIKGLEDYKARWTGLTSIEEQAKLEVALRNLGITTDDILNMSDSTFETFKANYLSVLTEMYSGNDEMINMLQELGGISPEALQPLADTLDNVKGKFGELHNTASDTELQITKVTDELIALDGMTSECTVKVNIETVGSVPQFASKIAQSGNINPVNKKSQVTGNTHYEGTAKVTGDWSVHKAGKALVGELGQEIVVRGSRFFTVGDNGPEFINLKENDIVFNHLQTKELLSKGNLVSRGTAFTNAAADNGIITASGETAFRPLQPGDRMYELQTRFNTYTNNIGHSADILAARLSREHSRQMQEITNKNNQSVINRNIHPSVTIGDINVTCPGVTEQQVAKQIGGVIAKELNRQFSGFSNYTDQQSRIR